MMRNFYLFILFNLSIALISNAQELNVKVQIQAPQVSNVEARLFDVMAANMREFMNNTRWTNDEFKANEKIDCTILITISSAPSATDFIGTFQIEANRPVYKSNYSSSIINFLDQDLTFKYVENQPFEFNDALFNNNITSILAFYAYTVLGYDYDSFSKNGGLVYFQKAKNVVNIAGTSNAPGWRVDDGNRRNRYWLVENQINPRYSAFHNAMYQYHLKGMDYLFTDPQQA